MTRKIKPYGLVESPKIFDAYCKCCGFESQPIKKRARRGAKAEISTQLCDMTEDDEDEFESVEEEIENTISFLVEHHDDAMRSLARSEREERLRADGFDEPTTDERRANLALNASLKDWPR